MAISQTETSGNNIRSTEDINSAINELRKRSNRIKIAGLSGQDSLAVGLQGNVELRLNGNVGKYFGSLNSGSVITLKGNTGSFTGDNMLDGGMIILGNAGNDAGINMRGGILVVKGNCEGDAGSFMTSGTMIIDGKVSGSVGSNSSGGTLIVNGDVEGAILENASSTVIYSSVILDINRHSLNEVKVTDRDLSLLDSYFKHYAISALPTSFKKYVAMTSSDKGWSLW